MKKIFIIAGEQSGDKIGALVIERLKELAGDKLELRGIGGQMMEKSGVKSLFPISKISLMGFFEVLPHIFKLKKLIHLTIETIKEFDPDIIVTIDSPGFCYRVIKALRGNIRTKMVHIVAPSVWAYKPERAAKFAAIYDLLLTLLPFEPPYFVKEGLTSVFVGHFAFEQNLCQDPMIFRTKYNIQQNEKLLCITPGSRSGEIKRHLPIFLETIFGLQKEHQLKAVILAASEEIKKIIEEELARTKFNDIIVTIDDKFEAYKAADIALAKSGTNSFEIALHGTPQIVAYKMNWLSWAYIKSVALIKFATLVNIIAKREIIPEFLQNKCKAELLKNALSVLLSNEEIRKRQLEQTNQILEGLKQTQGPASYISAKEILKLIS